MSDSTHTQEPWRVTKGSRGNFGALNHVEKFVAIERAGKRKTDADFHKYIADNLTEDDARRIVACVNVLADIGTDALEKIAELSPKYRFTGLGALCQAHEKRAERGEH